MAYRLLAALALATALGCSSEAVVGTATVDPVDGGTPDAEADGGASDAAMPTDLGETPLPTEAPALLRTVPASPGATAFPRVEGEAPAGAEVTLFDDPTCTGDSELVTTAGPDGSFAAAVGVAPGRTWLSARALLPGRSESPCSDPLAYVYDAEGPATPIIDATLPESPATEARITVVGRGEQGSQIEVFLDDECRSSPVAEVPVAMDGTFRANVLMPFGLFHLAAQAKDEAGNRSACSASFPHERILEGEVLFPPAPGVTEAEALTVRARLSVDASERVVFQTPFGDTSATYDDAREVWSAQVPLSPGAQSVVAVVGPVRLPLTEVTRSVVPRSISALSWDDAAGVLLLADEPAGARILAYDPRTGSTALRVDARETFSEVSALAARGGITYMAGRLARTGETGIASYDGGDVVVFAELAEDARPHTLAVRAAPREVLVAPVSAGVLLLDERTGAIRAQIREAEVVSYDPVRDEALVAGTRLPGTFWDLDTRTTTGFADLSRDQLMASSRLRFDANGDRHLAGPTGFADLTWVTYDGSLRTGPLAIESWRPATAPSLRGPSDFVLRDDTGELVFVPLDAEGTPADLLAEATLPAGDEPRIGSTFLYPGSVGRGATLRHPGALAAGAGRLVAAEANVAIELALGAAGGPRIARTSRLGETWRAAALTSGGAQLLVAAADGSLTTLDLDGPSGAAYVFEPPRGEGLRVDVAVVHAASGRPEELLEVASDRRTLRAWDLPDLGSFREIARLPEGAVVAVAHDAEADTFGVVTREDGRSTLWVVDRGGAARELASLDAAADTLGGGLEGDLGWADGQWWIGDGRNVVALAGATGTELARHPMPGAVVQLTAPDASGTGYATLRFGRAVVAFDGDSGDWVVLAR
ncbi:MAG: hypothetical protein AAGH15_12130 [Myxococcota bacterium]